MMYLKYLERERNVLAELKVDGSIFTDYST